MEPHCEFVVCDRRYDVYAGDPKQLDQVVVHVRVAAFLAGTDMFLGVHRSSDQGQQMSAMTRRTHAEPVGFDNHAGVDVPAAEGSSCDVLCAKCPSQINCSLDVIRVSFGLNPATLLLIKRPITVELKATVTDSRPRKRSAGDGVCIRHQRSHRRTLIANTRDPEIQKTWKQV